MGNLPTGQYCILNQLAPINGDSPYFIDMAERANIDTECHMIVAACGLCAVGFEVTLEGMADPAACGRTGTQF